VLHENEIEPSTEFVADLSEVGDTPEPQALVNKTVGSGIRRYYLEKTL